VLPFRDSHESFLNKLHGSRHGIRVDLYALKQINIASAVNLRGSAA